MSPFKESLDEYLTSDQHPINKAEEYYKLLNEKPEITCTEQELDNLIEMSFSPIDVSKIVVKELKKSQLKPVSDFALNIVEEIKQNERKKKKSLTPILFLSLAAVLALAFILLGLPQDHKDHISTREPINHSQNNKILVANPALIDGKRNLQQLAKDLNIPSPSTSPQKLVKMGDLVSGQNLITLPEGVQVLSYDQAQYSFESQQNSFLKMKRGKTLIDVESRLGKAPLFFNLPHGKVEVVGTQFELMATKDSSSVSVTEGAVNYSSKNISLPISAGQSGFSTDEFIKVSYNLKETFYHCSFDSDDRLPKEFKNALLNKGLSGSSLVLNQNSEYQIKMASQASSRSLSFWFRTDELSQNQRFILQQQETGKSLQFYMEKDNFIMKTTADQNLPKTLKFRVRYGWHHIVLNQAGDEFTLFLNGINIKQGTMPKFSQQNFTFGSASKNGFIGKVDEFRFFERKLSHAEVLNLQSEQKLSKRLN